MTTEAEFERIAQKFRDPGTLPQLPTAAIKLNKLLQSDNASAQDVELAVVSDPALTAALLRAATSAIYGRADQPVTTIRTALMRLGSKAVKAVSLSVWTQALVSQTLKGSRLTAAKFTDHSTFVGYFSRYIFSRRMDVERFRTSWSPDEILAAGVLHALGPALFAAIEPINFDRVYNQAALRKTSFCAKFEEMYGHSVHELGVIAVTTWGLDPLFAEVIGYVDAPETHPTESIAVACVHYADRLATDNGYSLFPLPSDPISSFATSEVGLEIDEIPKVISSVAAGIRESDPARKKAA